MRDAVQKALEELEAQKAITAELREKISVEEKKKEALSREKEQMAQKSQAEKQKLLQQMEETKDQAAKTLNQHALDFMAGMDDFKNNIERARKTIECSKREVPKLERQLAQYKLLEQELSVQRRIAFGVQEAIQEKRGLTISTNFQVELLQKELLETRVREYKKCKVKKKIIASFQKELEKRRKELERSKEAVIGLKKLLEKTPKFCSNGENWLCWRLDKGNEDNAALLERMEQMKAEMKKMRGRRARFEWRMAGVGVRGNEEGSKGSAGLEWPLGSEKTEVVPPTVAPNHLI